MLPLSTPIIGLIVMLDFIASWTNYFLPWVMYAEFDFASRYPVVARHRTTTDARIDVRRLLSKYPVATGRPPSAEALLLLVSAAPVVLVLLIAQRWIVSGRLQSVFN